MERGDSNRYRLPHHGCKGDEIDGIGALNRCDCGGVSWTQARMKKARQGVVGLCRASGAYYKREKKSRRLNHSRRFSSHSLLPNAHKVKLIASIKLTAFDLRRLANSAALRNLLIMYIMLNRPLKTFKWTWIDWKDSGFAASISRPLSLYLFPESCASELTK